MSVVPSRPPSGEPVPPAVQRTVRELVDVSPELTELGRRFTAAGFQAHLVGGSVRDALLAAGTGEARVPGDLDVTTDARPEQTLELLRGWAGSTWNTGIQFGTVGAEVHGVRLEITTFRADRYDRESRNPEVAWGDSLVDDLARRDFTVNAMAVSLGPDRTVTDPFGGLGDLLTRRLRTPGAATESFLDDPLRMLRGVRFVAQLGLMPDPEVVAAMTSLAPELGRITPERVQVELSKTLLQDAPRAALELFVDTGLAGVVLPELPALRMEIDEHHQHKDVYSHSLTVLDQAIALEKADPDAVSPDLVLRLAALLHDVGKPATRRHEPRGRVSFHHHEVVGREAGAQAADRAALPEGRHRGGRPAHLPAPAVPRVRRRRVDRLRRPPVRDRRRRPAPPAAQAGPLGLHDPEQAAGGGAVGDLRLARGAHLGALGRRRPRAGAAGPRRQRDHGDPRHRAGSRGGAGVAVPQGAAAGGGPAAPRRGRGRPPRLVATRG